MVQDDARFKPRTGMRRRQISNEQSAQATSTIQSVASSLSSSTSTITSASATSHHPRPPSETWISDNPAPQDYCTVALPSGGLIQFNDTATLYLGSSVSFQAPCGNNSIFRAVSDNTTVIPFNDPFYASIAPQVYVLAATTIISWLLVIILFITPRTFYLGGPAGSGTALGGSTGIFGRGMTFIGTGSSTSGAVGIGRRPLLQKIATITVAISLTIATSDTFRVAAKQYGSGYMDASTLVTEVVGSEEIRVTRVISDAFLWLAQVQTLIRLFPRHKEKVTIKWLGFGLVTCDTVFSILENFVSKSNRTKPESFKDAIPALSYLFELSISLIYASCVVYYSLSKRRYAFWHPKMRNVCLVALMSFAAILIPVVFFIVDVAQPDIATWGEYIRWVGAAAASVVVWEWVERIEALERDERKDGILGREIFDGDEMIDLSRSGDDNRSSQGGDIYKSETNDITSKVKSGAITKMRNLNVRPRIPFKNRRQAMLQAKTARLQGVTLGDGTITRPAQVATPISRSDTNSAASTVYAVRYHNPLSPSPAIPENGIPDIRPQDIDPSKEITDNPISALGAGTDVEPKSAKQNTGNNAAESTTGRHVWHHVANPFKRKRAEPPAEVAAQIAESNQRRSPADRPFNLRTKMNTFATAQKDRFSGRTRNRTPLQVTVIPAQPRLSRVDTPNDAETDRGAEVEPEHVMLPPRTRFAPRTKDSNPHPSTLPVTVIPAPIKGGRTWSPDDMVDNVSQDRHDNESSTSSSSRPHHSVPPRQQNSPSRTMNEPISNNSPARLSPGRTSNSSGIRSVLRSTDFSRNTAATQTSMSERLGESPMTVGGSTPLGNREAHEVYNTPSPPVGSLFVPASFTTSEGRPRTTSTGNR